MVVVPESLSLACSISWNNRNHFDGVFKESFRHILAGMFVFEKKIFSYFDKPRKAQNARAAAAP